MNLNAPEYRVVSDFKWNSEFKKDEIVKENTELNVKREELSYIRGRINLVNGISRDYYDLFNLYHRDEIFNRIAVDLENVYTIAQAAARQDTMRAIEEIQTRVQLSNAREC